MSQTQRPIYTLNPSFPVRRVCWRPDYPCELAVVSNAEFSSGSFDSTKSRNTPPSSEDGHQQKIIRELSITEDKPSNDVLPISADNIEIWDVRRGWMAKSAIIGSANEGGTCDIIFPSNNSGVIWAQHSSGTFMQHDLRNVVKPLDAVSRNSIAWDGTGSITFVGERRNPSEIPFDEEVPDMRTPSTFASTGSSEYFGHIKPKRKYLGGPKYKPYAQKLGAVTLPLEAHHHEIFVELARTYMFEGPDRPKICIHNQQVSDYLPL